MVRRDEVPVEAWSADRNHTLATKARNKASVTCRLLQKILSLTIDQQDILNLAMPSRPPGVGLGAG